MKHFYATWAPWLLVATVAALMGVSALLALLVGLEWLR